MRTMAKGKTFFAGLGAILTGLGMICHALAYGDWHTSGMQGWYSALAGLSILGIGHKIEKQTAAAAGILQNVLAAGSNPSKTATAIKRLTL